MTHVAGWRKREAVKDKVAVLMERVAPFFDRFEGQVPDAEFFSRFYRILRGKLSQTDKEALGLFITRFDLFESYVRRVFAELFGLPCTVTAEKVYSVNEISGEKIENSERLYLIDAERPKHKASKR